MRTILSILVAAGILGGIATAQPAEARCWWNGYSWHCSYPEHPYWRHHYRPYGHHEYWRDRDWR